MTKTGQYFLQWFELIWLNIKHEEIRHRKIIRLRDFFLQAFFNLRNQVNQQGTQTNSQETGNGTEPVTA